MEKVARAVVADFVFVFVFSQQSVCLKSKNKARGGGSLGFVLCGAGRIPNTSVRPSPPPPCLAECVAVGVAGRGVGALGVQKPPFPGLGERAQPLLSRGEKRMRSLSFLLRELPGTREGGQPIPPLPGAGGCQGRGRLRGWRIHQPCFRVPAPQPRLRPESAPGPRSPFYAAPPGIRRLSQASAPRGPISRPLARQRLRGTLLPEGDPRAVRARSPLPNFILRVLGCPDRLGRVGWSEVSRDPYPPP